MPLIARRNLVKIVSSSSALRSKVDFDDSCGSRRRLILSRRHQALSAFFIFSVGIRAGYLSARSVDILIERDALCVSSPDFPGVHNGFVVPLAVTLMSGLIGDLVARLPPLAADRIAHPK